MNYSLMEIAVGIELQTAMCCLLYALWRIYRAAIADATHCR